jgi:Tfp pilus assembly protein FimT
MVVVMIITIFAGLAIPSAVRQLRDRRLSDTAGQIATLFRQARLQAMGRGSAVLVRFNAGTFSVREARMGARNVDCSAMPYSSCVNNDWNDVAQYAEVAHYEQGTGDLASINVAMASSTGNAVTGLDLCFTPMGAAFARESTDGSQPLIRLGSAYTAEVSGASSTRSRHVVVLPNGTARLTGAPGP